VNLSARLLTAGITFDVATANDRTRNLALAPISIGDEMKDFPRLEFFCVNTVTSKPNIVTLIVS
jgi:hypothetical protein